MASPLYPRFEEHSHWNPFFSPVPIATATSAGRDLVVPLVRLENLAPVLAMLGKLDYSGLFEFVSVEASNPLLLPRGRLVGPGDLDDHLWHFGSGDVVSIFSASRHGGSPLVAGIADPLEATAHQLHTLYPQDFFALADASFTPADNFGAFIYSFAVLSALFSGVDFEGASIWTDASAALTVRIASLAHDLLWLPPVTLTSAWATRVHHRVYRIAASESTAALCTEDHWMDLFSAGREVVQERAASPPVPLLTNAQAALVTQQLARARTDFSVSVLGRVEVEVNLDMAPADRPPLTRAALAYLLSSGTAY